MRSATAIMSTACASVAAIGFSLRTWTPRSSAAVVTAWWAPGGLTLTRKSGRTASSIVPTSSPIATVAGAELGRGAGRALRDEVDPGGELDVGRVVQLEAPVRTQVARADDHAAQRRGPADRLEAHRSNQPAGDSGAPGAPPCPPAGGAAQRTAFASTRRTSGWWYTGYSWSPGPK